MKLWTTSCRQPSTVRASNHAFVKRSSSTMTNVSQSQRRRAGMFMMQKPRGRSCRRDAGRGVGLDFGKSLAATFAHRRITRVLADVRRVVPAALAFFAVGTLDFDGQSR